jgi:hypothetical protein
MESEEGITVAPASVIPGDTATIIVKQEPACGLNVKGYVSVTDPLGNVYTTDVKTFSPGNIDGDLVPDNFLVVRFPGSDFHGGHTTEVGQYKVFTNFWSDPNAGGEIVNVTFEHSFKADVIKIPVEPTTVTAALEGHIKLISALAASIGIVSIVILRRHHARTRLNRK